MRGLLSRLIRRAHARTEIANSLRHVLLWRLRGISVGPGTRIGRGVEVSLGGRTGCVRIGPKCILRSGAQVHCHGGAVELGHHVYVGEHVVIYGHGGVAIGDNSLIGMHTCIIAATHRVPTAGGLIRREADEPLPVRIGSDVWLGAGVKVLGGVTIGDGCVVGAGAVVTKDLPPGSRAVGVPARVIGRREDA
ncbi:MAG: acyltransferase [Candidatus Sumerlaeia bacterium]|nr:acyltransferase [Candidatus Sumerlaeia bacterium]